ncbi:hypothetical protein HZ326_2535 [Fusarium oxysporum f. sp. albedinis]|nr:hypothetical protein HZ326_2535 [Fusarium oxysporum f. sp. albedinis]
MVSSINRTSMKGWMSLLGDDFCECTAHFSHYTQVCYTTGHTIHVFCSPGMPYCTRLLAVRDGNCQRNRTACRLQGRMGGGVGRGLQVIGITSFGDSFLFDKSSETESFSRPLLSDSSPKSTLETMDGGNLGADGAQHQ